MDWREYFREQLALAYRSCLWGHDFVAVTGSVGKTTTVRLIKHILSLHGGCHSVEESWSNQKYRIRRLLRQMPPWCRTCVAELSASPKGNIAGTTRFYRPTMGVVTSIGFDHYKMFRGPEGAAAEKGKLLEVLPGRGVAILNADDQGVMALAERTKARVVTFGLAPDADVRGEDVSADWPDRLAFTLVYRGARCRVQTRLVGTYWVSAVLASIAVALEHGFSLEQCAQDVASFEPVFERLSVHEPAPGVHVLLDTWKAAHWTMDMALQVMASARAERRILVVGTISDYPGSRSSKYRRFARDALACADQVWFAGPNASHVESMAGQEPRLRTASDVRTLCARLWEELRPGDLVLVKASQGDHLERVVLYRESQIACWKTGCGVKFLSCKECRYRLIPADPSST